jgi:hypothetical protein
MHDESGRSREIGFDLSAAAAMFGGTRRFAMQDDKTTRAETAVEEIGRFADRAMLRRSPFHLSACGGCGCPSFQQPCSLCSYWPSGSQKGTWSPKTATREQFVAMVERSGPGGGGGTIATWHARSRFTSVAWSPSTAKEMSERAAEAASKLDVPSADEIWDVVVDDGTSLDRRYDDAATIRGWSGVEELRSVAGNSGNSASPRILVGIDDKVRAWIAAVHSDDRPAMSDAIRDVVATARNLRGVVASPGNLEMAIRDLEASSEHLSAEVVPAP